MGEGKESARAQVLAARALLGEELVLLEASGRAAVDIRAKVRRNPAKAAGVAAGVGFVALGGPKKVLRGARNAIFGKPDPLPKSMLPAEIEKALKELGSDGERVRGTLEREFAGYLKEKAPQRKERNLSAVAAMLLAGIGRPVAQRYGRQLVERLLEPDGEGFAAQLDKVRARVDAAANRPPKA
ncbi:MAG: hypothetical protein ACYC65_01650 [Candidatus Limnocylindrales bacterium]